MDLSRTRESGGILVYIFIGIILFAALAYAFSKGGGSTGSSATDKSAKLYATQVIGDVQVLRDSVQEALAKGCSESEISFDNDTVAGYSFATRDMCKIFKNSTRSTKWIGLPEKARDPSLSGSGSEDYNFTMWYFLKAYPGGTPIGTVSNDIAVVANVNQAVCEQINLLITGDRTIPTMVYAGSTFASTAEGKKYVGSGSPVSVAAGDTVFNNICVKGTTSPEGYGFLYSLIDR